MTEDRDRIQQEYNAIVEKRNAEEDSKICEQSEAEAINNLDDFLRSKKI